MYPLYLPLHAEQLRFESQEMDTIKLLLQGTLFKSTTRAYDTKILTYCTLKAVYVDFFLATWERCDRLETQQWQRDNIDIKSLG